jgi:uncharacterized membrane protein SpoIIM required for sporulation
MDLDAYADAHADEWERLAALSSRRRLTGAEADELIALYQSGTTQLSAMATQAGSTVHGERLSLKLSAARLRFAGVADNPLAALPHFFLIELPAALYRLRWITLAVAVCTAIVSLLFAFWALSDPRVLASFGSNAQLKELVDHQFVNYYSANPAASFTGQVWTNNAWIAAQCIAFGIVGVYVPVVILQNAQNIGVDGAVMFAYGKGNVFFEYIAPHGMLELTSVFVAAAAGLRIFWAWIAPGARTRAQALAEDGRALFAVAIGLVLSLLVSGIIEGFVTPSSLPWPVKIGIGALALAAFLSYMLIVGGRAVRAGATGDIAERAAGAQRVVSG